MKKILFTIVALASLTGAAYAADLAAPKAAAPVAAAATDSNWYAGATLGFNAIDDLSIGDSQKTVGASVGYEFSQYLRAEVALTDFTSKDDYATGQTLIANGIAQLPTGTRFTPYVLAGVGAGFNGFGDENGDATAVYDLGVGARYAINAAWDVDARYTRISDWNTDAETDVATIGVNYNF